MKSDVAAQLEKAARSIAAARVLLADEFPDVAASRIYYAMFYVAKALLADRGLSFRTHSGAHAAYGDHFAKSRVLDPKFHRWLLQAFATRITADYGTEALPELPPVDERIKQAEEFLAVARAYLERGT